MFDFLKNSKDADGAIGADGISERWFKSIIAELNDAVIGYDPDFKITIFNAASERLFNLTSPEVLGHSITLARAREPKIRFLVQVIFPSLAPSVVLHSDPGVYPQVADMHFDDVHLRVITNRILNEVGTVLGFTKVIHDRTREISILKSKSEFLTVAAHQLRTPLTAVNWSLEGLLSDATLSDSGRELVATGSLAAKKLLKIIEDLLDVAKLEEGKFGYHFEEGKFIEFLEKILLDEQAVASPYGIKIYFDRPKEDVSFFFDKEKLALAITNLLDNAIKYNVPNGSITVTAAKMEKEPRVLVIIKDTGLGIPPEAMDKLFTKFFRAENAIKFSTEGSGLGLYLVKNVISRHGGKIWVESELNRGTTFYFTLSTDPKIVRHKETTPEDI
jgi:signal transduction histidine kinase